MAVNSGIVGAVYKQSSTTDTFTTEASTLQADNKSVIIDDDSYVGFVRDHTLFTVYKDASPVTADYEIHFDRVIFKETQTAGTWTISGTYCELEQVGGAYDWSLDTKHNVQDKTEFGDTWEQKIKGLLGWSSNAKRHYIDDDYIDIVDNGVPIILRLFTDIDNYEGYVMYGQIDGIKAGDKVDGITDGEISFSGDGTVLWLDYDLIDIP